MGVWIDAVEAKARKVHAQLAAARALAERNGTDPEEMAGLYLNLLRQIYEEEFAFARMADSADLVARFGGPAVETDDPAVGVVMSVFSDLRAQIRGIAKSIVGLSTDRRLRWPAELDPRLSGLTQGSLVVGIRVPDPTSEIRPGQISFPGVSEQIFESVRAAVRSLAIVARYVGEDSVDETLRDEFPDPAVRDTVMVAASRLAPTGRKGIDSVSLYGTGVEPHEPQPLTPRSRQVLTRALARPVRVRGSGGFEGIVREIDLDARRFEIRSVQGIGALRCVYDPNWTTVARTILDAKVQIRGTYETLANQQPRLLAVETIVVLKPPPQQLTIDES